MKLNRSIVKDYKVYPERIIQFGEGNFLRAFVDWMVHEMNQKADFNSSVVLVQPIDKGMVDKVNEQDGLYTLITKGIKDGVASRDIELIRSVSRGINPYADFNAYLKLAENPDMRFVVSNTTEAGIAFNAEDRADMRPPKTFPGKLAVLLYHRFKTFSGDKSKGFIILPCELINRNGDKLKKYVLQYAELWKLEPEFSKWIEEANVFCNTLVDRIVPGYPFDTAKEIEKELGYEDNLIVEGESFHLWVIEGPEWIQNELPIQQSGLNILVVDDVTPYRTRKVLILNGAHTILTPVAYLSGIETVREGMEHPIIGEYLTQTLAVEVIPTMDLPKEELVTFADSIEERFRNPYIRHTLMSIALNSISKFKARVLPSLVEYHKLKGFVPVRLCFALAALILFYRGRRDNKIIELNDEEAVISLFTLLWKDFDLGKISTDNLVATVLRNQEIWGEDLTLIPGLAAKVTSYLDDILYFGILKSVENMVMLNSLHYKKY